MRCSNMKDDTVHLHVWKQHFLWKCFQRVSCPTMALHGCTSHAGYHKYWATRSWSDPAPRRSPPSGPQELKCCATSIWRWSAPPGRRLTWKTLQWVRACFVFGVRVGACACACVRVRACHTCVYAAAPGNKLSLINTQIISLRRDAHGKESVSTGRGFPV